MLETISILLFLGGCIAFVVALNINRANPPTRFERFVATCWLIVRRTVMLAGALLFLLGAWYIGFIGTQLGGTEALDPTTRVFGVLVCILMFAAAVWTGIFGSGSRQYDLKDDVELHKRNRRRFGWRW